VLLLVAVEIMLEEAVAVEGVPLEVNVHVVINVNVEVIVLAQVVVEAAALLLLLLPPPVLLKQKEHAHVVIIASVVIIVPAADVLGINKSLPFEKMCFISARAQVKRDEQTHTHTHGGEVKKGT